ncbi:MAG TPA: peptide-methionine (S)-S-oxide reductase MsrA [Sulfuriferula sp.]|nr:peptide-methionine (S)-S-oxide reductase MsrA [Sulfuriferula sp.]
MTPDPAVAPSLSVSTLAGGCFWCLEAVYERLQGVHKVTSGYMGGHTDNPSYEDICTGTTGHAEVVRIEFDPAELKFETLLEVFFTIHDPTTLNRQGNDRGTQYRSAIFYHTPAQQAAAERMLADLTARQVWANPIVTEISPATTFYPAENYHQEYFRNHAQQPYCQHVVAPKLSKFLQVFPDRSRTLGLE